MTTSSSTITTTWAVEYIGYEWYLWMKINHPEWLHKGHIINLTNKE